MANKQEKDPTKVALMSHRICFPHLDKPTSFDDSDEKTYQMEMLIPDDHEDVDIVLDAIDAAFEMEEHGKLKGAKMTGRNFKLPFTEGEVILAESDKRPELEGHWLLRIKSKRKPIVYNIHGEVMEDYDVANLKSGDVCRAVVKFAAYNWNNTSKGIGAYINSVVFMEEGEQIGGSSASFDDYGMEAKPKRSRGRSRDVEDDEPAPRRRSRREEPEDEPAPSRRRSRRDDDDEDEPAPRRRRASEDDEPPRRRSRNAEPEDDYEDDEPAPRRRSRNDEDEPAPSRRRR